MTSLNQQATEKLSGLKTAFNTAVENFTSRKLVLKSKKNEVRKTYQGYANKVDTIIDILSSPVAHSRGAAFSLLLDLKSEFDGKAAIYEAANNDTPFGSFPADTYKNYSKTLGDVLKII